ncbi:MAG: helicase-associated domain-containing protein [Synergistaceae bacterium]|jgi:hypothetical protein|nr:helicase-associated domain-containing protein [Synergistaceae bacterium]
MQRVENYLTLLAVGDKDRPGSLRHLALVAGDAIYNKIKGSVKDEIIKTLCEYYYTPNRFNEIWTSLSAAERKIVSIHVWGNLTESPSWADYIAQEYRIDEKRSKNYYISYYNGLGKFKERYSDIYSKLWLLFPQNEMVIFYEEILRTVGALNREYSVVPEDAVFTSRENRYNDFANIVKFCNSNRVTVTKSGMLSKSSAIKLPDFCDYEEYAALWGSTPKQMRTTDQLLVTFPLTALCIISGLLATTEGLCVPGSRSLKILSLPYPEMIVKLYDAYLKSKSFDEISVMTGIKAKRRHCPFEARQNLVAELQKCPIGKAVYTSEFERYLQLVNKNFARKVENYVVATGNDYYGVNWDYYEHPLIFIILSFFGALGIVDIVWGEGAQCYADKGMLRPIAFRINPLGAYVLGCSSEYKVKISHEDKKQGGFTVLPDYTIIVSDSSDRLKHEIYFERLFTKLSETKEATIYKLDFDTIVRTCNLGKDVDDIRKYLTNSDKPLPDNVAHALEDWKKQIGRIRLRQVTILECDDAALLEEVIHYKGMGDLVHEKVASAVIVDGEKKSNIKKVIEKNGRFCRDII